MRTCTLSGGCGGKSQGLYDIQLKLNGIPLLEPDCPPIAKEFDLSVREIMSDTLISLQVRACVLR